MLPIILYHKLSPTESWRIGYRYPPFAQADEAKVLDLAQAHAEFLRYLLGRVGCPEAVVRVSRV